MFPSVTVVPWKRVNLIRYNAPSAKSHFQPNPTAPKAQIFPAAFSSGCPDRGPATGRTPSAGCGEGGTPPCQDA
jgi:hypothetical protein